MAEDKPNLSNKPQIKMWLKLTPSQKTIKKIKKENLEFRKAT